MKVEFTYVVYPGSELIDLGSKRPASLACSEEQAIHMASFWKPHGYYVKLANPLVVDSVDDLSSLFISEPKPRVFCMEGPPQYNTTEVPNYITAVPAHIQHQEHQHEYVPFDFLHRHAGLIISLMTIVNIVLWVWVMYLIFRGH